MKFIKNLRFAYTYIVASMFSYFAVWLSSVLYSYNLIDIDTEILCFIISVLMFTIVFAVFGVKYKEDALVPVVFMIAVKLLFIIFMTVFEDSFISLIIMFLDILFTYTKDFMFYILNIDYNISAVIAFVFSCLYPIIIFAVSKSLTNIIRKRIENKKYEKAV